jgi:hypothetical protein
MKKYKRIILAGIISGLFINGIIYSVIAYYMKVGFNLKSIILFDIPLYVFIGWAIYKGIYKHIKRYELWKKIF